MCPVSMTYAAVPALRDGAPELAAEWEPRLTKPDYDDGALAGMAMTERQGGSDVRANITRAEPVGDGVVRDPRPQVVLLVPAVRRVPGARAGARRALVLPRRARAGDGVPAAQGQARDALAAVLRGRVPRRSTGRLIGEEGRGVPGDHPDGQPHAARLPARRDHRAAPRHARGDPPRPPPLGVRRAARRPAGDAQRARRPGDRVRGGDRRARCGSRAPTTRRRGGGVPAVRDRGDEVLGLQARAGPRGRGARVPGRQRLRRGLGDAAAVPRRAARTRSGRARATSRRSTCCARWSRSPRGCRRSWRSASSPPAPTPGSTPTWHASASRPPRCSPARIPQFVARRVVEDLALALQGSLLVRHAPPAVADAFCATRLGGRGRPRVRDAAGRASTPARSSSARCPV